MKTNQQFKNEALAALRGNWRKAVIITIIYLLIACLAVAPSSYTSVQMRSYVEENVSSHTSLTAMASMLQDPAYQLLSKRSQGASGFSTLVYILLLFPLTLGYANAMRKLLISGDNNLTSNTFRIAFSNYWHKVWGMLWMEILVFLWSLLLIIPGIIKSFSYAMTPFILEENPELDASAAIHRSRMMMRGHQFDLFWLFLGFLGWLILSLLTLGIGLLWLVPYMETSLAAFYEEVKADYALNGGLD